MNSSTTSPASSIEEAIGQLLEAEVEAMERTDPPAPMRTPRGTQPPDAPTEGS